MAKLPWYLRQSGPLRQLDGRLVMTIRVPWYGLPVLLALALWQETKRRLGRA